MIVAQKFYRRLIAFYKETLAKRRELHKRHGYVATHRGYTKLV